MLKTVYLICLMISISIYGCKTNDIKIGAQTWEMPSEPKYSKTEIISIPEAIENNMIDTDGYYLSGDDGEKLADNITEMKAYIKKLTTLIEHIQKYHNTQPE